MPQDATIELLEDIVKELQAASTLESAARELAIAIAGTMNQIMHHNEIERTVVLITAALKRCRNEALEEAAKLVADNSEYHQSNSPGNSFKLSPRLSGSLTGLAYTDAIRQLKEAE